MNSAIDPAARETIRLLLTAASKQMTPGEIGNSTQFVFGPPHLPTSMHRLVAEVYFKSADLLEATLHLRHAGPSFLRALSIDEVKSELMSFLRQSYWMISDYVFGLPSNEPFISLVPPSAVEAMAVQLQHSKLFAPEAFITVYPLIPILIATSFISEPFFLVTSSALTATLVDRPGFALNPEVFPPISNFDGGMERPASWLGVRAVSERHAKRTRNAVLGAIALLPHHTERYFFSGRHMFGGQIAFRDGRSSISYRRPCTPPLMENLTVGATDQAWLQLLSQKLTSDNEQDRRQLRALEYFYRAWPLPTEDRVPLFFMALDAIFGDPSQHTQTVVSSLRAVGLNYDETRLTLLMKLRAAVIHGGAPDVYDSSRYLAYFARYRSDAVIDLERVAARALQFVIFQDAQGPRRHTHADLIKAKWGVEP